MFWLGDTHIVVAIQGLVTANDPKLIIGSVMSATDASLFGIVLVIFAYAIAFGFAFDVSPETHEKLPPWMRINRVSDIKHTLIEVILVYLVVDSYRFGAIGRPILADAGQAVVNRHNRGSVSPVRQQPVSSKLHQHGPRVSQTGLRR